MGQKLPNDLALMSIEREELEAINREGVINKFAETKVIKARFNRILLKFGLKILTGWAVNQDFYPGAREARTTTGRQLWQIYIALGTALQYL